MEYLPGKLRNNLMTLDSKKLEGRGASCDVPDPVVGICKYERKTSDLF